MFIKITYRGLQSMMRTDKSPAAFGLEHDEDILHYKVIDKPLFFLTVLNLGVEFDEISQESRADIF
jgi:hypothetical protein